MMFLLLTDPNQITAIMQDKNVPTLNRRYWITILVASVLGTTFGDFVSNDLKLGFAGGLLVLSAVITVIFIAEKKVKWNSVAWYWAAIVATRTAATNLGDFLTRTLKLGNGLVAALLAGLLITFLLITSRSYKRTSLSSATNNVHKLLPKTDSRYWIAITIASTLGTAFGDFISGDLGLGLKLGALFLVTILALALVFEFSARTTNEARYWALIAIIRTTGTVLGDYLTSEEGLNLGFATGASLSSALLVIILLLPPTLKLPRLRR
jgi:uncharacterized membrane-anchored protein